MSYEPAANQSGLPHCYVCKKVIKGISFGYSGNPARFCSMTCKNKYDEEHQGLVYDRWA